MLCAILAYTKCNFNVFIQYIYSEEQIKLINEKVDTLYNKLITSDMSNYDKILTIHDYIINNTKYDIERNMVTIR